MDGLPTLLDASARLNTVGANDVGHIESATYPSVPDSGHLPEAADAARLAALALLRATALS